MDKNVLIKRLNTIFCDTNKKDNRYSEVWLSDVDFGGLYTSDKYVLNVKAVETIDYCNAEIRSIIDLLDEKDKEALSYIWRVDVYTENDEWHCSSEDIMVYNAAESCP